MPSETNEVVLDGRTYRLVTPEIQALLDTLPAVARFTAARCLTAADVGPISHFEAAWRDYLVSRPQPVNYPEVVVYVTPDADVSVLGAAGLHWLRARVFPEQIEGARRFVLHPDGTATMDEP